MTIQFSKQPIVVLSEGPLKMGSGLVRRLVSARNDSGKERIRKWLINIDDAKLQSGLGLTVEDITVLREWERHETRVDLGRARLEIALQSRNLTDHSQGSA